MSSFDIAEDNRISVDVALWEKQKTQLRRYSVVKKTAPAVIAIAMQMGLAFGQIAGFYHLIPKVITLPPQVITKTVEVVKYKPYDGLDPDLKAQAVADFEESHYLKDDNYHRAGEPRWPNLLEWHISPEQYDKKWDLPTRIEVRRILGLLNE